MKTYNYELGVVQNLLSKSSFIEYLIITLIHSIQINKDTDKNIFSKIDIAEIAVLFFILFANFIIFIKLKRIVREYFK